MRSNKIYHHKQWKNSLLFLTLATLSSNIYAEYYLVYPAPAIHCISHCDVIHRAYHPIRHHLHKKHIKQFKHIPHRPIKKVKMILVPYYLSAAPTCSCQCSPAWIPNPCTCCPHWHKKQNYATEEFISNGYYYSHYSYDPDLATGDDNQSIHPNMNIDY
jgi:hypothetical protein